MPNVDNYKEQGGTKTVVGGTLEVGVAGEISIASGGKITAAGTQAAAIADAADGTEIATINAIIAALEGVGIIAAGE